jgi:hypothetical protein
MTVTIAAWINFVTVNPIELIDFCGVNWVELTALADRFRTVSRALHEVRNQIVWA